MITPYESLLIITAAGILLAFVLAHQRLGFLLMVFCLPVLSVGDFDIGVRIRLPQFIAMLLLVPYFLKMMIAINRKMYRTPYDMVLILFCIIVLMTSAIKALYLPESGTALYGGYFRNTIGRSIIQSVGLIFVVAIYFMCLNVLRDKKTILDSIKVLLLSAVVVALYGIYQFVGYFFSWPFLIPPGMLEDGTPLYDLTYAGLMRISSVVDEPKGLAFFLIPVISLLLPLILFKRSVRSKLIGMPVFLLLISVFTLTFARSGWILLVLSGVLILILSHAILRKRETAATNKLRCFVSFLMLMAVILGIFGGLIRNRFISIYNKEDFEYSFRSEQILAGIEIFKDNMLLGIGLGNFSTYFPKYGRIEPVPSQYFSLLVETGLLGFGIFIYFIAGSLVFTIRSLKKVKDRIWRVIVFSLLCGVVGMLVEFLYNTYWFNLPLFWFLLAAMKRAAREGLRGDIHNEKVHSLEQVAL